MMLKIPSKAIWVS